MNGRRAFIITKPLQFMVACTIIDDYGIADDVDLLIADSFSGAAGFVSRYHGLNKAHWGRIGLFDTIDEAYRYARREGRYNHLYIDSDFGVRKSLMLLRYKLRMPLAKIIVYEEGVGTYRSDVYPPIKRRLFNLLGVGAAFGGCRLSSEILIFDVEEYINRVGMYGGKPSPIRTGLVDFIRTNLTSLEYLFDFQPHDHGDDSLNLYLTSWSIDRQVLTQLSLLPGELLLKPHPHIKNLDVSGLGLRQNHVMQAGVPSELLIMKLMDQSANLTVYHHGSSSAHYMRGSGAKFVDISNPRALRTYAASSA